MSGERVLPWSGAEPERDARPAAELGQPEGNRQEAKDKAPDQPVGEPSGPGSTVQTGAARPGRETGSGDRTTGEAMLAPTMPGEDPGVA